MIALALPAGSWAQTPLWQGKGRIVVSADGNEHDHDDWAATPLSLALLAARGLQDHVPLYIYADHVWGSNHEHPGVNGVTPYEQMRESALTGGRMFGFGRTRFVAAVDDPEIAYEALKDEINRSSAEDPLFIVAAGPVHVIGEAISRARRDQLRFVSGVENYYAIDASDAGKVAFLLTGIEDTSPQLCYEIMKAPVRTPDVFHCLTEAGSFASVSGAGAHSSHRAFA